MSTNIKQVNPGAVNQETDPQYAADALTTNGAPNSGVLPSNWFNKFAYQTSTFIAALAQALSNKGYNISDANLATLIAQVANVMTQADMGPYAQLNSPVFSGNPQAPTPPTADADTSIATTAFVKSVVGAFGRSATGNGFLHFPVDLGGLMIQWALASASATTVAVGFPTPFPSVCLAVFGTTRAGTQTFSVDHTGTAWTLTGNGSYWLLAIGF